MRCNVIETLNFRITYLEFDSYDNRPNKRFRCEEEKNVRAF